MFFSGTSLSEELFLMSEEPTDESLTSATFKSNFQPASRRSLHALELDWLQVHQVDYMSSCLPLTALTDAIELKQAMKWWGGKGRRRIQGLRPFTTWISELSLSPIAHAKPCGLWQPSVEIRSLLQWPSGWSHVGAGSGGDRTAV